jgi:hypothetical protein
MAVYAEGNLDIHTMLIAFFDDSSDPKKERFCAAGGLFTSDTVWERFEVEWRDATRGLSGPFHATDCECGYDEFVHWSKTKRDGLMATLTALIRRFDIGAFGSAVSVADYFSIFPASKKHDPFYLCIASCIANVAAIAYVGSEHVRPYGLLPMGVKFWIERNVETAARTTEIYDGIKSLKGWRPARLMEGITHGGKNVIGLQAADLMAREVFKHYDNHGVRPVRKPVLQLAQQVTFHCWTKKNLEFLAANGGPRNSRTHARFAEQMMSTPATRIGPPE